VGGGVGSMVSCSKIDDMSAVVVVLKPTSEAGPLVGWDEEQTWGLSDVVHPGSSSSSRSRTTTRLVRLLTSIPRWQASSPAHPRHPP
jgi:hypothetical protein